MFLKNAERKKVKEKHEMHLAGYSIKEYLPILFFFSIIAAIYVILSSIENPNFLAEASAIYLLIVFLLYHYSKTADIENKNHEIAQLKQEIRKLETIQKNDEHNTKLHKKEIE